MDLIVFTHLTNQVGRIVGVDDMSYNILWITEEGAVGNIVLWKLHCSVILDLHTYINFEIKRDYKYRWKIVSSSVEIISRHIGSISSEHFCISLTNGRMYNTNPNNYKKIKMLEYELVFFCLGDPAFMDRYDQTIAIRTHILAYSKVINITDNELFITWRKLKFKYKIDKSICICLKDTEYIYAALDITNRQFDTNLEVDNRNVTVTGIILEEYGKVIDKNNRNIIQCSFGTVIQENKDKIGLYDNVLVRCFIERSSINYSITHVARGTVQGSTILGKDDNVYTWKMKNTIGNMYLEDGDNVIFEVGDDKHVSNIKLIDRLKSCDTYTYISKNETGELKLFVRDIEIYYKGLLDDRKMYKFVLKWNKEWLRFEAESVEIELIDEYKEIDIDKEGSSSDEKLCIVGQIGNTLDYTIDNKYNHLPNRYTTNRYYPNGMVYNINQIHNTYYNNGHINEDDIW